MFVWSFGIHLFPLLNSLQQSRLRILTRISSLMRRSLHVIHNHLEFAFAVIRRRIEGSFILQTQQLLVLWQLYLVLSVQEHRLKENGFNREGKFSLLIEKVDLLVDGHRNLLIDVSGDPRMLQCTLCIVSD